MKKLFLLSVIMFCLSCASAPSPILIYDIPKADVSDDMTVEDYVKVSTEYAVNMKSYIDELINQILHKANYIDLRKGKRNDREYNKDK